MQTEMGRTELRKKGHLILGLMLKGIIPTHILELTCCCYLGCLWIVASTLWSKAASPSQALAL